MNLAEILRRTKNMENRADQLESLIADIQRGELSEEILEKFPNFVKLQQRTKSL